MAKSGNSPLFLAAFGHQTQALRDGMGHGKRRQNRSLQGDGAVEDRINAEHRPGQFGAARADKPGQSDDLSRLNRQTGAGMGKGRGRHIADIQQDRARNVSGLLPEMCQVAADHQPDHRVAGHLTLRQFAGIAAIAQHDHPVSAGGNFIQPVTDEQHGHALRLEARDDPQQCLGFGQRQAGGWFIEDNQPRAHRPGSGNFKQLHFGQRQVDERAADFPVAHRSKQARSCLQN